MSFEDFLSSLPPSVLTKLLEMEVELAATSQAPDISHLLNKTVLLGGKRLRPLFTYCMGHFFNLDLDRVTPLAVAIERVHAASLAHDDVIDLATTRRGRPSINQETHNKLAILAGDFLLAQVIVDLTKLDHSKFVEEMAKVIQQLAQGEWLQHQLTEKESYEWEKVEEVARKKTASVMSWCSLSPALLANANESLCEYARQLGIHLGLAFQFIDDTLDFKQGSMKDICADLQNGVISSVIFELAELNSDMVKELRQSHFSQSLASAELDLAILNTQKKAAKHLDKANELLDILNSEIHKDDSDRVLPLRSIFAYLKERNI